MEVAGSWVTLWRRWRDGDAFGTCRSSARRRAGHLGTRAGLRVVAAHGLVLHAKCERARGVIGGVGGCVGVTVAGRVRCVCAHSLGLAPARRIARLRSAYVGCVPRGSKHLVSLPPGGRTPQGRYSDAGRPRTRAPGPRGPAADTTCQEQQERNSRGGTEHPNTRTTHTIW
jgi:hypothetical protein